MTYRTPELLLRGSVRTTTSGGDLFEPVRDLLIFNAPWVVAPARYRADEISQVFKDRIKTYRTKRSWQTIYSYVLKARRSASTCGSKSIRHRS